MSPSAGQLTALSIYLSTCLLVVVGAMIEFAILLYIRRKSEHKVMKEVTESESYFHQLQQFNRRISNWYETTKISEGVLKFDKPEFLLDDTIKRERRKFLCESNKIDFYALILFALMFILFNVCYWIYYIWM